MLELQQVQIKLWAVGAWGLELSASRAEARLHQLHGVDLQLRPDATVAAVCVCVCAPQGQQMRAGVELVGLIWTTWKILKNLNGWLDQLAGC